MIPQQKQHHLSDPIATCGNRLYVIGAQNGGFPDSGGGHVPHEMHGVWAHPIKLLDGLWFGVVLPGSDTPHWLIDASTCRAYPTYTEFDYAVGPYQITRRDFVPDDLAGLIVTLTIHTQATAPQPITLISHFRSDLRPVWLGEQTGLHDAPDQVVTHDQQLFFSDTANPWHCIVGAYPAPTQAQPAHEAPQPTFGPGTAATLRHPIHFDGQQAVQIRFFIAGSSASQADALDTWQTLHDQHQARFAAKQAAYDWLIQTSQLVTPDPQINAAATWTKINAQWLARHVPGFGTCVGAGLPEYPWWFGIDTEYAVLPLLQSGQFELVRASLHLLHAASLRRNPSQPGRVIHEMSTNGAVYNEGNVVEAPVFVRALHQYWQWTGDGELLRALYPFCKQAVLDYTLNQSDPDGDLCPSGRSIIETLEMHSGVECIDVAAYTCEALKRLSDMAAFLNETADRAQFTHLATQLHQHILTEWWLDDAGLFADVRASKNEITTMLSNLAQAAQDVAPDADDFRRQVQLAHTLFAPELQRHAQQPHDIDLPWSLRHWVVMCPVEVGLATPEQAKRVLARLQTAEFCNEWGMYLHPDRHDVMSINTGLLALAAARNGHIEAALTIVQRLAGALSYRTPGTICEALPDQWCFVQLWSNLGVISPVVEGFLGIQPDVGRNRIYIQPHLPATWSEAQINNLRIGTAQIGIHIRRTTSDQPNQYDVQVAGAHPFEIILA